MYALKLLLQLALAVIVAALFVAYCKLVWELARWLFHKGTTMTAVTDDLPAIARFAYACFGYQLEDAECMDVVRLLYGQRITERYGMPIQSLRGIARQWMVVKEAREAFD